MPTQHNLAATPAHILVLARAEAARAFRAAQRPQLRAAALADLTPGDVFTTDHGRTWYTTAAIHPGSVSVHLGLRRDDHAPQASIPADAADPCLIMTSHPTEITYYQVVWGPEETDSMTYPDHHDGSYVSETAEYRATKKFLEMITARVPVGFYVNGERTHGTAPATEDPEPATAAPGTAVVVIGPNLFGTGDDFHIHAAGCADTRRNPLYRLHRDDINAPVIVTSLREIIHTIYPPGDFDYDPDQWHDFATGIKVFDCLNLPDEP